MRNANDTLIHGGIEEFSHGTFEDGGTNLYVNANGVIETIHRTDVNNDGYVDIVLPNSHGYIERGPTWIYRPHPGNGKDWERQELPNDSSWMSRIVRSRLLSRSSRWIHATVAPLDVSRRFTPPRSVGQSWLEFRRSNSARPRTQASAMIFWWS